MDFLKNQFYYIDNLVINKIKNNNYQKKLKVLREIYKIYKKLYQNIKLKFMKYKILDLQIRLLTQKININYKEKLKILWKI